MSVDEAKSHLRAALMQVAPSDDRIIVEHIEAALAELDAPVPIGVCSYCGAERYTKVGFCGGCRRYGT